MATDMQVGAVIKKDLTWLQSHERLVLVFMVLLFAGFLGNRYINYDAAKKDTQATIAAQLATEAKASAQQAAQTAAQTAAQYQAMVDMLQKQNATLAQAITQRDAILGKQQTEDRAMPPSELVKRWQVLVPNTTPVATPTGVTLTTPDAQSTVATLESVPVLTKNLANETEIAANIQKELDKSNSLTGALNTQVTSLNGEIVANDKACKTEIAAVKAEGKKNSIKWFKRGFLVGFVSGLWVGHSAGL
jgi:Tfp pilus assembly protein PilV